VRNVFRSPFSVVVREEEIRRTMDAFLPRRGGEVGCTQSGRVDPPKTKAGFGLESVMSRAKLRTQTPTSPGMLADGTDVAVGVWNHGDLLPSGVVQIAAVLVPCGKRDTFSGGTTAVI